MQTIALEGRAFVLSANQCIRRKNLPSWITEEKRPNINKDHDSADPAPESAKWLRRSSIITKTEDNHEITWPLLELKKPSGTVVEDEAEVPPSTLADGDRESIDSKMSLPELKRQKSLTTKLEGNHEIAWLSPETKPHLQSEGIFESPQKINPPSPLRFSALSVDDEADDYQNTSKPPMSFRQQSSVTRLSENHLIALPSAASSKLPNEPSIQPSQRKPSPNTNSNESNEEFVCRGGSCIISPTGTILAGPLWEVEGGGLLFATVDFEDCERGKLDLDVAGSYGRGDAFELKVKGLDINPPS